VAAHRRILGHMTHQKIGATALVILGVFLISWEKL
jgi:hypothetical protein